MPDHLTDEPASAATVIDDEQDFGDLVLRATEPVLVEFFTEWCGPCTGLAPTLDDLAAEYLGRARIVKVDAERLRDLTTRFGVTGYPTMILFVDGEEIDRPQVRSRLQLRRVLDAALGSAVEAEPNRTTSTGVKLCDQVQRLVDTLDRLGSAEWQRVSGWIAETFQSSAPRQVARSTNLPWRLL